MLMTLFVLITPPLFHPNFWGVPVGPDRPVGRYLKLFGRKIIFLKYSNLYERNT